ncbi:4Fe-4S dicluster domain-containing protein [Hwanghaeella sp.]|uniref:4Fe-4S dicluster domain-containing protein n=1 Tax=Hwanghaeella sp. TaxID=2605943 RepID=UPI003CCBAE48
MRLFSHTDRPVHLGRYPMERLPRMPAGSAPFSSVPTQVPAGPGGDATLPHVFAPYIALYKETRDGPAAPSTAPIPEEARIRTDNLKAGCYFLDAAGAGTCRIPAAARLPGLPEEHDHALVILVEHGPMPDPNEDAFPWLEGSADAVADLRAAEIAVCMAGYLRNMGYDARAHFAFPDCADVDIAALALQCGLTESSDGKSVHPYIGTGFRLAAVTTDFRVTDEPPLARRSVAESFLSKGPAWWLGLGGSAGRFDRPASRALHLGPYPMEKIKRVDRPTTMVDEAKIKRVAKRAEFFQRALMGDLGDKAQRERNRFAVKNPYAFAMVPLIRGMVPFQHGETAAPPAPGTAEAERNARAVKGLAYHLGADMVGICEAKDYAWYTHDAAGKEVPIRHKYAVVMLIDQGFETMEGSSGDDWISGAQSMRSYMRGAQIAGVMAAHLRRLGHDARSQTNADSEVLHIPLILWAGLGEMSRIGELVLNPFVGPRFKSVVLTTDMPLEIDKPVDFGLLDFCEKCTKCARECPCSAIPLGPRIEYNGYEIWKPDVERCTRYRVTNPKGSACGRCMKTCPYNTEGLLTHRAFLWAAINIPASRKAIAEWDDKLGNGSINRTKKWWFDLEQIDGAAVAPRAGANERQLDLGANTDPAGQKIALYPPAEHPPGDMLDPRPIDRKQALERGAAAKTFGPGSGKPH